MLDVNDRRTVIADMWQMHMDERLGFDRIYEYTKGIRGKPEVPEGTGKEVKELAELSVMNVLSGIRDTFTRNLSVVGYRRANATENDPAWAMWQRNRMDARQKEVHKPAVTYGCSYVTALNGDRGPVFRIRSPRQLLATYRDPTLDAWPQYGFEVWIDRTDAKPRRVGMLLDDEMVYPFDMGEVRPLPRDPDRLHAMVVSEFGEPYAHGATYEGEPVCPIVRYVNDRDADDWIVGEIAPLIDDQRAINSVNFDRLIVSRFGAFPQRVISGWSGTRNEVLAASASRVWTFEDETVKAQTFAPASIEGYTALIEAMKAGMYEKAGLSPAKSGKLINLAAEALALAEKDETEKLNDKRESLGESHEQLLRLGAEMDGDDATAIDSGAEVVWRDTSARSLAAVIDGITKLAGAGVPIAPLLPMVPGVTQQQVRGIQDAMQAERAQALVTELRTRRQMRAAPAELAADAVAS